MNGMVYTVNKGINRAIEFRGLKAQYIGMLAVGLVGLLLGFAILYISGVPSWICIGLALSGGLGLFRVVYRWSRRYGQHGMMKRQAAFRIPRVIRSESRRLFERS